MPHKYRIKAAWLSYLSIQVFWALCVVLIPVALSFYPSRFWALPFCIVTASGGLHMTLFWREYNALLRKTIKLLPFERYVIRYLAPAQRDQRHFLLFGAGYTLFGVVSAALIVLAPAHWPW